MALKGIGNDTVKQAIQDVIAPQIQELKGEIAALRGEMGGLRGEMRQFEKRVDDGFAAVRGEMRQIEKRMDEGFTAVRNEMALTHKRVDDALEIRERLAALEARFAARS
jgi:predicted  nucleic acid-binding Zn-ribbon protein